MTSTSQSSYCQSIIRPPPIPGPNLRETPPPLLLLPSLRSSGNPNEPTAAEKEAEAASALSERRSKTIEKARKQAVESGEGTADRRR